MFDRVLSTSLIPDNRASNYMFKVNDGSTRTRCEICSKLTMKKDTRATSLHWSFSGVFIVNFEHISLIFQVFLLLTLSR